MKLRNKRTGEIATLTLSTNGENMIIMGNDMLAHITKLSELKDYEDYEEPKEYWHIFGTNITKTQEGFDEIFDKRNKEIGNVFETKEEAEKAVEKLKAWKRLKDKGFEFCCDIKYENLCGNGFNISLNAIMPPEAYADIEVSKDLDSLFGGKE